MIWMLLIKIIFLIQCQLRLRFFNKKILDLNYIFDPKLYLRLDRKQTIILIQNVGYKSIKLFITKIFEILK